MKYVKYVKALGATNREAIENFYNRMPDDTRKRVFSQVASCETQKGGYKND